MTDRKHRILIAEDFDDNRIALKLMLNLAGFETLEAEDGRQAVEIALAQKPDLILMDISLPEIDGLQATKELRAQPGFAQLPIIVLSAYDSDESRQQALAAGSTAYLAKPIEFEDLKNAIGQYLNS